MTELTPEEAHILRCTLGLSYYNRINPTRNHLNDLTASTFKDVVASLFEHGYLEQSESYGPGGKEFYYRASAFGREAALEQPWK